MKKITLVLLVFLIACNSEEDGIGVSVVTPEGDEGLDGIIAVSVLETYDDTTWIVDLEDNSRIENGCDYSLRMLLHVSINKLEILQYEYRICDSENVCINKNHMVKETKMKERESSNTGYEKITDISENSFVVGTYLESDDEDFHWF